MPFPKVTKADLQQYCERDPGGETKQFGGKLTTAQCVANYLRSEGRTTMAAQANCRAGTVSDRYGDRQAAKARCPLGADGDTAAAEVGGYNSKSRRPPWTYPGRCRTDHRL